VQITDQLFCSTLQQRASHL